MTKSENNFFDTVDSVSKNEKQNNEKLEELRNFYHNTDVSQRLTMYQKYDARKAYKDFLHNIKPQRQFEYWNYVALAAAAAVIGFIMILPGLKNNEPSAEILAMLEKNIPALTDSVPTIITNNGEIIKLDHESKDMKVNGASAYVTESGIAMTNSEETENMLELDVPRGRQYQIALPDGTTVILNSGSKLKFPNRMDTNRKVYLEGEAYFDVKKNGNTFMVGTSAGTIVVMGTTFNVRSYDANHAGVALYTGKISFRSGDKTYLLRPGEEAIKEGSDIKIHPIEDARTASWRDGLIIFKDQRLEAIMNEIERIYGVEVEFKADVKNIRFSGECRRTQTVDDFMKKMSLTDEFNYEIHGKKVTIE